MRKTLILAAALLAFGTAAQAMPDVYGGMNGLETANGIESSNAFEFSNGLESGNGVVGTNGMTSPNGMVSPNGAAPAGLLGLRVQDITLPGQPALPLAK